MRYFDPLFRKRTHPRERWWIAQGLFRGEYQHIWGDVRHKTPEVVNGAIPDFALRDETETLTYKMIHCCGKNERKGRCKERK